MARPIWKGLISFGLVSIPVNLITAAESHQLNMHLLDARNKARIRYQRINVETGKEVPWDQVVKAYEIEKNEYVIVDEKQLEHPQPAEYKSFEINEFVDLHRIDSRYFDKPYYVLPDGKNNKAYVLLREALKKTHTVGVGKVMLRTKEYLALIVPHEEALVLNLIRFKDEIRSEDDLVFPDKSLQAYKITPKEMAMAVELITDMTAPWKPEKYHDQTQEALMKWIKQKSGIAIKRSSAKTKIKKTEPVVDMMTLLKQSLCKKGEKRKMK